MAEENREVEDKKENKKAAKKAERERKKERNEKKKEKVEYGYNGEFSAISFFECIREELKKMEAYHD